MPESGFADAAIGLIEAGEVDALEWSFDMGWGPSGIPPWLAELLAHHSAAGTLFGHGVSWSLLSGAWTPRHGGWLERLRREVDERQYVHLSEHIGFMGGGPFVTGPPLPVPVTDDAVVLGRARLDLLGEAAGVPVGVENLATALGPADVADQGGFVQALLDGTDRFLLLDLHNLWCQAVNMGVDPVELLGSYPLDRVAEIHISGGSWSQPPSGERRLRRDTHDHGVPDEVFALLAMALERCDPRVVVLEQLGSALTTVDQHQRYRDDFRHMKQVMTRAA